MSLFTAALKWFRTPTLESPNPRPTVPAVGVNVKGSSPIPVQYFVKGLEVDKRPAEAVTTCSADFKQPPRAVTVPLDPQDIHAAVKDVLTVQDEILEHIRSMVIAQDWTAIRAYRVDVAFPRAVAAYQEALQIAAYEEYKAQQAKHETTELEALPEIRNVLLLAVEGHALDLDTIQSQARRIEAALLRIHALEGVSNRLRLLVIEVLEARLKTLRG